MMHQLMQFIFEGTLKSLPMLDTSNVKSECKANTLFNIYVHVNLE